MGWDGLSGGQKAFAVGIAALVVVSTCNHIQGPASPAPASVAAPAPPAAKNGDNDLSLMACMAAQREVKNRLKAPATANFPSCGLSLHEYKITANDSRTKFGVQGYVDSQNGYGANIRSRFVVLMHKGPGDGSSAYTAYKVAIE